MIDCTVGVMAYNEAANIGNLLAALLRQELCTVVIRRIVVVASGCTDEPPQIVQRIADEEPRVRLVVQEERRGKASAINAFLPLAVGDVVVLESADTIPEPDAIERLVAPFADQSVGMTGARPVPTNDPNRFWGHAAHLLWGLHHDIALQQAKLGEMIAFRRVMEAIPGNTAVDEASIEAEVSERGLDVRYVPEAIVHNTGPDTLADFLRQRRRIHAGHLHLRETSGHEVSTMKASRIVRLLLGRLEWSPRKITFTAVVAALEAWARTLAMYDYRVRKKNPFIWDIAGSTKAFALPSTPVSARGYSTKR